ncbi:hypothetical protein MA16_Dca028938 [Dendrobium catenatum]|uniref:Uncharacterized protein n=1 Tax=Dendrobium catenatum TaxID=906689 RepID=A0A2I0VDG2_9ASPA|nr:hypothetical protein MA16_Dca028938 [Dendrobium catenatum]
MIAAIAKDGDSGGDLRVAIGNGGQQWVMAATAEGGDINVVIAEDVDSGGDLRVAIGNGGQQWVMAVKAEGGDINGGWRVAVGSNY